MLGIGWVMFWKALLLGVCVALWERWQGFKKQRGLRLRLDRRGVYVADGRLERFETYARRGLYAALAIFVLYGAAAVTLLVAIP